MPAPNWRNKTLPTPCRSARGFLRLLHSGKDTIGLGETTNLHYKRTQMTASPESALHPFIRHPHRTVLALSAPVLLSLVAEPLTGLVDTSVPRVQLLSKVLEDPEAANPAEVVAAQRQAIDRHRNEFDFILLDTAPLLSTNDAAEVLDECDLVVVVGRTGQTTKEAADRAAELLERRNAPVVGVVLVAATDRPSSRYYYYGDAGRYYADEDAEPETGAQGPPDIDASTPPLHQLSNGGRRHSEATAAAAGVKVADPPDAVEGEGSHT